MKMTEYLLGDVCSRLSSGKSIKSSQVFEKGRFPVFGGNGIRGYTDTFNFSGECAIVGRQGAYCGNVQFYKGCAYMTEHAVVVCGNQKSNTKFLGLVLQKMNLGRLSHQAAQPGLSVKILAAQKIKLPAIETQTKIAQILTAYDDLIETNQKQIKLLEEAAQRLYKEWFVGLRFPGHEKTKIIEGIPEGWVQCRLENVIHFNPKVTLSKERMKQSIPMSALSTTSMVLNADDFTTTLSNSGSKFQNGDTLLARITPCLENGKTAFVSGIESDEGAVGSTEFIIMRSNGISPYMVYLLARTEDFRQEAINSMIGSDGRQRAQVDKIKVLPYLKPSEKIIKAFEKSVAPLFAQIQIKNKQCTELKQARDRLLPKLMNGEIAV